MTTMALRKNDPPATHKPALVASPHRQCQVPQTVLQKSFKQSSVGGVKQRPSSIIAHL